MKDVVGGGVVAVGGVKGEAGDAGEGGVGGPGAGDLGVGDPGAGDLGVGDPGAGEGEGEGRVCEEEGLVARDEACFEPSPSQQSS